MIRFDTVSQLVCPTQVGIHLGVDLIPCLRTRLPHAGGDTPSSDEGLELVVRSAPRRWGYTLTKPGNVPNLPVCPTQVGIHRIRLIVIELSRSLPHAGGDTPDEAFETALLGLSAPRRWGYTSVSCILRAGSVVCPTQVGIHLQDRIIGSSGTRLPHAGGDTPLSK